MIHQITKPFNALFTAEQLKGDSIKSFISAVLAVIMRPMLLTSNLSAIMREITLVLYPLLILMRVNGDD